MTVTLVPDPLTLVDYATADIVAIVERLRAALGLPAGLDVRIELDETTPLSRAEVTSADPVVLAIESGAFEDAKRPCTLSPTATADVLGRLLLRVRDRRDPAFGDAPADTDLSMANGVAWDVYCIGRLVRAGFEHHDNRQRRLYHFRTRHGFSDAADAAFDRLWTADDLTWSEIAALSDGLLVDAG